MPTDELDTLLGSLPRAGGSRAPLRRRSTFDSNEADDAEWDISRADEVRDFFKNKYGRDLPVRVIGQGGVHNREGYDHRNAMDVSLNPASAEGRALTSYLREQNIPFLAFDRPVRSRSGKVVSTGPHVHIGRPSSSTTSRYAVGTSVLPQPEQDGLDNLLQSVPRINSKDEAGKDELDNLLGGLPQIKAEDRLGFTSTSSRVMEDMDTGEPEAVDLTDSQGKPLSVRPVELPAGVERSVSEKMASAAQDFGSFRENSDYQQPISSGFGVSETFMVKIPGDERRYPTQDEVRDAIINASPELAAADKKYRAETGRSIGNFLSLDMGTVRRSFNPESKTYDISVNASNRLARIAGAYLDGGMQAAQDENTRLQFSRSDEAAAMKKDAGTPRTWGDTARAAISDVALSEAQLIHNVGTAANATAMQDRHSPQYEQLQQKEAREQAAIDTARSAIPEETGTGRKVARSVVAGVGEAAPYVAAGAFGAPVVAMTQNLNRGLPEATKQGLIAASTVGTGTAVGNITQGMKPIARQALTRGTMAGTMVGTSALAGERDPEKLLSAGILGGAFPVGKAKAKSSGSRPGELFEGGSARVRASDSGRTQYKPSNEFVDIPLPNGKGTVRVEVKGTPVPEKPATLAKQMDAMERGTRKAVLVTPGALSPKVPSGYVATETSKGLMIHKPETISRVRVREMADAGTHGELLGITGERGSVVVLAKGADGTEYQAAYSKPENALAQARVFRSQYPDASIEIGGRALENSVLVERLAGSGRVQMDALLRGDTHYAEFGAGESVPAVPKGYVRTRLKDGSHVIHSRRLSSAKVREFARRDALDVLDMTMEGESVIPELRVPGGEMDALDAVLANVPQLPHGRLRRGVRVAADAVNAFKSAKSSGDVSALLRQGLMFISEPRAWYRGMKRGVKSLSEENYLKTVDDIRSHSMREWAEDSGLYLATQGGGREEAFPSQVVNRLPGIKHSEQSFNATLDTMRLETFNKYARMFAFRDMHPETHPKAFRDLARRINSMSGRGDLGRLNQYAEALNVPIFSPRLIKARLDILNPLEYMRLDPAVRKIALKQTAKVIGAVSSSLMLAKASGAEVGVDPESSDFLKIKVGETRYDITGGNARYLRDIFRVVKYATRLGADGVNLRTDSAAVGNEVRKNLAPLPSYLVNAWVGSDVSGKDFAFWRDTLGLVSPLLVDDLLDAMQLEGATGHIYSPEQMEKEVGAVARGLVRGAPAAVGVGTQSYVNEPLRFSEIDPNKVPNTKANEKIANDPELRAINDELKRLDTSVQKAARRRGESDSDYLERLADEEPKLKAGLIELFESDEYQGMTDVERLDAIQFIERSIRNVERE